MQPHPPPGWPVPRLHDPISIKGHTYVVHSYYWMPDGDDDLDTAPFVYVVLGLV